MKRKTLSFSVSYYKFSRNPLFLLLHIYIYAHNYLYIRLHVYNIHIKTIKNSTLILSNTLSLALFRFYLFLIFYYFEKKSTNFSYFIHKVRARKKKCEERMRANLREVQVELFFIHSTRLSVCKNRY
jgi:hypothetical protein